MDKKLFFGSNLKMYKNIADTTAYLQELADRTKDISRDEIELFIIPSFTTLPDAVKWLYSFAMLAGRLEFFTMMVFFSPSFWKK